MKDCSLQEKSSAEPEVEHYVEKNNTTQTCFGALNELVSSLGMELGSSSLYQGYPVACYTKDVQNSAHAFAWTLFITSVIFKFGLYMRA